MGLRQWHHHFSRGQFGHYSMWPAAGQYFHALLILTLRLALLGKSLLKTSLSGKFVRRGLFLMLDGRWRSHLVGVQETVKFFTGKMAVLQEQLSNGRTCG